MADMPRPAMALKHFIGKQLAIYQTHMQVTRLPEVVSGEGKLSTIGAVAARLGMRRPLVVTDAVLVEIGLAKRCTDALTAQGLAFVLFDKVLPNCPERLVEEGFALYSQQKCDGIIALGGGSPMDCAKVIGLKATGSAKPVRQYVGMYRAVGWPWLTVFGLPTPALFTGGGGAAAYPPLVAVPSTAGTGSEATCAAVVSFEQEHLKLAIMDPVLVPKVALLDPLVTVSMPANITAATGMDALTHAVESHLSYWQHALTREHSLRAIGRIGKHLLASYRRRDDLTARTEMLLASYEAGVAFTRANVGYVHAIAHTLGGKYGTPHGVANAMLLPHVLDFYLEDEAVCVPRLAECGAALGLPARGSVREQAARFVDEVRRMNAEMALPTTVARMREADVRAVATRALVEAHGQRWWDPLTFEVGYPVPCYMDLARCEAIVRACLPPPHSPQARL